MEVGWTADEVVEVDLRHPARELPGVDRDLRVDHLYVVARSYRAGRVRRRRSGGRQARLVGGVDRADLGEGPGPPPRAHRRAVLRPAQFLGVAGPKRQCSWPGLDRLAVLRPLERLDASRRHRVAGTVGRAGERGTRQRQQCGNGQNDVTTRADHGPRHSRAGKGSRSTKRRPAGGANRCLKNDDLLVSWWKVAPDHRLVRFRRGGEAVRPVHPAIPAGQPHTTAIRIPPRQCNG